VAVQIIAERRFKLGLSVTNPDSGTATEELLATMAEGLDIGFNAKYLLGGYCRSQL